jgi:multidrug resistance efflux pump
MATSAALQRLADARDQLRSAERYLNNLLSGSRSTDIDKASANVVLFKDKLDQAQKDFAAYEKKPENNLTRAAYLSALADAQQHYDDAVRLLNNLLGTPSDIDLAIAEADLALAQASLAVAEQDYEDVRAGPDPDDLEVVEAQLKAAESSLNAARAALSDAELVAPISGTIVKLEVKAGEQAVPGLQAAVVADLTSWKVETDDLNEMEIPRVHVDQPVTVIPDALPELELVGRVESISDLFEEKFGDVTYTTTIRLSDVDPRLRWGMTVLVRFEP